MTARRPHPATVAARLRELVNVYETLAAYAVDPDRHSEPVRGAAGAGPRTLPVNTAALDHAAEIERLTSWLLVRGKAILGWHLPPVPVARRGFVPCPNCGTGALWIDRVQWAVQCRNQPHCHDGDGRPLTWRMDRGEVELLGEQVDQLLQELYDEAAGTTTDPDAEPDQQQAVGQ